MLSCFLRGTAKAVPYIVLGTLLAAAAPAHAQIYTWRDANGTLVLSNRRPGQNAPAKTSAVPKTEAVAVPKTEAVAVPKTEAVRATRSVATERTHAYDDLISEHSRQSGVRADLVRAVMQVESAFNPMARSVKGALGLMQLMPATIRQYGVRNPFDPGDNVRAGVGYLRELLDRYENNEELALAAYNAGPTAVDKHGQSVPPYRETKQYVAQISQMASRPIETRGRTLYKYTEIINGREVPRYTDKKPATGSYTIVGSR